MEQGMAGETRDLCDDAALYLIGGLEESRQAAFQSHLEECALCRQFIADVEVFMDLPSAGDERLAADKEAFMLAHVLRAGAWRLEPDLAPRPVHKESEGAVWRIIALGVSLVLVLVAAARLYFWLIG